MLAICSGSQFPQHSVNGAGYVSAGNPGSFFGGRHIRPATPEGLGEATAHQGQLQEVRKLIQEFIETQDIETGVGETGGKATKLSEYIIVYEQERGLVISFKDTLLLAAVLMN